MGKPTNQSAVGSLFGLLGTSMSTKADQGPIAHDCNCGNRVDQWATGKQSVEKCRAECLKNEYCLSFGLWTKVDKGHCALFDQICTDPCPNPTSISTGYRNDVYNVNKGDLDGYISNDQINSRLVNLQDILVAVVNVLDTLPTRTMDNRPYWDIIDIGLWKMSL